MSAVASRGRGASGAASRTGFLTVLSLLAALPLPGAATQVVRWTDSGGGVHYGHEAPAGVAAERVTLVHEGESGDEARADMDRLLHEAGLDAAGLAAAGKQQAAAQGEAAAARQAEAKQKQECLVAEQSARKLENWAKRILVEDGNGKTVTMNSDQRSAAIARVRKYMADNGCS